MIASLVLATLLLGADTGRTPQTAARALPFDSAGPVTLTQRDAWLGEDKFKHFAFSYAITAGTAASARAVTNHDAAVITGAAMGIAAGIAKELYDRKRNGSPSLRDLLWDFAGIGAAVLLVQQAQ